MKTKYISLQQAVRRAGDRGIHRTEATMINWCTKHHIGHQLGERGNWLVDPVRLEEFLDTGKVTFEEVASGENGPESSGETSVETSEGTEEEKGS